MKRIFLLGALVITGLVFVKPASAQFHVSVNIGLQPAWGPAGYDYAEYYYLPDIEAYYCVPTRQFVYFDDGRWCTSAYLPGRCSNYDLYSGYKVVINERDPWCHFNEHRRMYAPYMYRHDQVMIGGGRGYGYGDYGRPRYDDRGWNRGRGWGDYDRRRDWDDHRHGWDDHERGWERHEHDRDGDHDRGHGRRGW